MRIEHLSLTNFRNYARLELSLPAGPVILQGDNAQGKTSILEAIYYLATSSSPYTTTDRQLLHWRTEEDPLPFARLAAEIAGQRTAFTQLDITLILDATNGVPRFRKVPRVNGVEKRVMDTIGLLNVVLFLPRDLALVEGTPSDRRRWMNDTLAQVDPRYYQALQNYEKILPQRNALLRRIAVGDAAPHELGYWDEQLVHAGSIILAGRQRLLRELEGLAQGHQLALTDQRESLALQYQPSFSPTAEGDGQRSFLVPGLDLHRELTPDQIMPQFNALLERERAESIQRGVTLSGPHRDELRMLVNGRDCGLYGSRGQARTVVLALKLAELAWMARTIGEWPVLLLDEVVAELDARRRAYLTQQLQGEAQILVTTTDLATLAPEFLARAAVWRVVNGQVFSG
jgi:DNA replication and repair protein RecF